MKTSTSVISTRIDPLDGAAGLGGNLQIMGNPGRAPCSKPRNGSAGKRCATDEPCRLPYRRDAQAIWYDSPNWNGFTFGAAVQTDFAKSTEPNVRRSTPGCSSSVRSTSAPACRCRRGARTAIVRTSSVCTTSSVVRGAINTGSRGRAADGTVTNVLGQRPSSKDKAFQLGVGYTLGDIYVFGVWEQLKYDIDGVVSRLPGLEAQRLPDRHEVEPGERLRRRELDASPEGELQFRRRWRRPTSAATTRALTSIGVGYYHTMSKQTQVYVVGSWLDNQDQGNYGTAGISNTAVASRTSARPTTVWASASSTPSDRQHSICSESTGALGRPFFIRPSAQRGARQPQLGAAAPRTCSSVRANFARRSCSCATTCGRRALDEAGVAQLGLRLGDLGFELRDFLAPAARARPRGRSRSSASGGSRRPRDRRIGLPAGPRPWT